MHTNIYVFYVFFTPICNHILYIDVFFSLNVSMCHIFQYFLMVFMVNNLILTREHYPSKGQIAATVNETKENIFGI